MEVWAMSQIDLLLTKYSRRRGRREELRQGAVGILIDVFMFRRMITPWLIRVGFLLFCVLALVLTTVAIVQPMLKGSTSGASSVSTTAGRQPNQRDWRSLQPPSHELTGLMLQPPAWLSRAVWEWIALLFGVCVARVLCEGMIVVFQINESLTDVRRRLEQQNAGNV